MNVSQTPQGRVKVDQYRKISDNCYVMGDAVAVESKGRVLKMEVMFALSEGVYAASSIIRSLKHLPLKKFPEQADLGYVVPLANNRSCDQALGKNIYGLAATFLHYSMSAYRSQGFKNQIGVLCDLFRKK